MMLGYVCQIFATMFALQNVYVSTAPDPCNPAEYKGEPFSFRHSVLRKITNSNIGRNVTIFYVFFISKIHWTRRNVIKSNQLLD